MINFKDIKKKLLNVDANSLYLDRTLNENGRGIDYNNYIKLRYETINNSEIRIIYTVNGWYLMWYLMSISNKTNYTKTTINSIAEDIKLNPIEIKNSLIYLNGNDIIKINKIKNINYNTPLEIITTYNDEELYKLSRSEVKIGYKAIPIGFASYVLPQLTPQEWAIYCVLVARHNYYTIKEIINNGEIMYSLKENLYAFPTMKQIEDITGISETTIYRRIKDMEIYTFRLIKTKEEPTSYIMTIDEKNNKKVPKRVNNKYEIPLLQRVEYIYNHIVNVEDQRDSKFLNKLNKIGFDEMSHTKEYYKLTDRDYLISKFGNRIEDYKKAKETNKSQGCEIYSNMDKKVSL